MAVKNLESLVRNLLVVNDGKVATTKGNGSEAVERLPAEASFPRPTSRISLQTDYPTPQADIASSSDAAGVRAGRPEGVNVLVKRGPASQAWRAVPLGWSLRAKLQQLTGAKHGTGGLADRGHRTCCRWPAGRPDNRVRTAAGSRQTGPARMRPVIGVFAASLRGKRVG